MYHRRKQDIDIVLLDIGLPKIAGLDVVLRMKEDNSDVKVMVASDYIEPDFKSKMQRAGVQSFIEKPYNPDHVVSYALRLQVRAVIELPSAPLNRSVGLKPELWRCA